MNMKNDAEKLNKFDREFPAISCEKATIENGNCSCTGSCLWNDYACYKSENGTLILCPDFVQRA